ncbi:thioredoxin family protein [Enterovibrio nigricans]|uniref:Thioredoxin 1 n=1 Tax=Enterovibrio nigricans DSM 22720 TaxID=1121868 RepID=A0A1T4UX62_9GAMM|nr:thioredoxin family protein [Enterovibrio nigricans]PKF50861.1 thioredoxin [Enterovibrio nigricans]SKA57228.1 thioredoxin 1 [Enterovibrio nigricans DSM 22720]
MTRATTQGFNPDYDEDSPTFEEVSDIKGFAIVEFGAPWCGHCQAAQPAVEDALSAYSLPHVKVFDGKGKPLGRAFKVKLWPTLILLRDGLEVDRIVRPIHTMEVTELLSHMNLR